MAKTFKAGNVIFLPLHYFLTDIVLILEIRRKTLLSRQIPLVLYEICNFLIFYALYFSQAFLNQGVPSQPVMDTPVIDPMTGQAVFPGNIPDPIPDQPVSILNRNPSKGSMGEKPITQPPKPSLKKTIRYL